MLGWLFGSDNKDNKRKTSSIEKELHDIYGYSKKELAKMSEGEKEALLCDEYEEEFSC